MIYIKSLDKSKRAKLISIVSCVAIFFVFVLGCVDFALGSVDYINMHLSSCGFNYSAYVGVTYQYDANDYYTDVYYASDYDGRICSYVVSYEDDTWGMGILCSSSFSFRGTRGSNDSVGRYTANIKSTDFGYEYCTSTSAYGNSIVDKSSNIIMFSSYDDAKKYMLTGEINNPLYQPKVNYEYDSSIEIPLMAQCQVNGNDYLFNCKQSVPHDDYKLQVAVDLRLTPIYGNFASKQYSDKEQIFRSGKIELGSYDNKGTIFNTSFSTDDLLKGIDTDRKSLGFKEFYHGYNLLLPYKEPVVSEVIFYARNVSGSKCSNWVRVTFDLITETSKYEEVESVSGSNIPSDTKTANSEYYPEDYVYNDNDAYGGGSDVSSTLNSLEHNYTQLVNFYKDLFSFLPSEIWLLLIGLVSTMVIIAIIKFVRG